VVLLSQNLTLFKTIVKDCFQGLPDPPSNVLSAKLRTFDMEAAIENKAQDLGLVAHKPWVAKCMQLYSLSLVHHGKCFVVYLLYFFTMKRFLALNRSIMIFYVVVNLCVCACL
jgi:hypothetical protein